MNGSALLVLWHATADTDGVTAVIGGPLLSCRASHKSPSCLRRVPGGPEGAVPAERVTDGFDLVPSQVSMTPKPVPPAASCLSPPPATSEVALPTRPEAASTTSG